jgi:hypothetical protein
MLSSFGYEVLGQEFAPIFADFFPFPNLRDFEWAIQDQRFHIGVYRVIRG